MRILAAAMAVVALSVAGCTDQPSQEHQHGDTVSVVASTDVWGSVASAVVGDHATVKSLVTSAVADPHSFEATPADAAAITDASLVVFNGGGYDHWVDDVLASHPDVNTVDAYTLSGQGAGANEHVFYDPDTAKAVADSIAEKLSAADPGHADGYRANAAEFGKQTAEILDAQRAVGKSFPGASVVATEPVAYYLLRNAGLTDRTPPTFAAALEEGDDPSPADLGAVLDLINTRQVSALVVNTQTETPATTQIQAAAKQAGVPTISVTETLPENTDYVQWQLQTAKQFSDQLGRAATAKP